MGYYPKVLDSRTKSWKTKNVQYSRKVLHCLMLHKVGSCYGIAQATGLTCIQALRGLVLLIRDGRVIKYTSNTSPYNFNIIKTHVKYKLTHESMWRQMSLFEQKKQTRLGKVKKQNLC